MSLLNQELTLLNRRGLIPGPCEDEEAFTARCNLLNSAFKSVEWEEAHRLTHPLFDISVDWVEAYYSNKKLPFWQGAATWIDGTHVAIQLKTAFKKGSFLKIYHRYELLAHEAVHAARIAFDEPQFEEILAYATSSSNIRKILGPFFQKSWESYFFLLLLALPLVAEWLALLLDLPSFSNFLFLPMMGYLVFGSLRLFFNQMIFRRALKKLGALLEHKNHAHFLVMRLTDSEIVSFARWPLLKIQEHIDELQGKSLRWRMLSYVYPKRRL